MSTIVEKRARMILYCKKCDTFTVHTLNQKGKYLCNHEIRAQMQFPRMENLVKAIKALVWFLGTGTMRIRWWFKRRFGVCPDCGKRFFNGDHTGHFPF